MAASGVVKMVYVTHSITCEDWMTSGLSAWHVGDVDPTRAGKLVATQPVVLQLRGGTKWTFSAFKKDKHMEVIGPPFKANVTKQIMCMTPMNASGVAWYCCVAKHMHYRALSQVWKPSRDMLWAHMKEF